MKYPKKRVLSASRQTIEVFGGYNHNDRIGDGEFYYEQNISADSYPVFSPRKGRSREHGKWDGQALQGLIGKDALCVAAGGKLYVNGYEYAVGLKDGIKHPVSMGAYIVFPEDRKWFNTADGTWGQIDAELTSGAALTPCLVSGAEITFALVEPETPKNKEFWLDQSAEPYSLKQWSEAEGMWVAIATTYVKISMANVDKVFDLYDGVDISAEVEKGLENVVGSNVVWAKGENYIVVSGLISGIADANITLERKMPVMDHVIECGNRLWGCRYGPNSKGEVVNEIYCSKLGDFKNWHCFMGVSTDSWYGQCGTDGVFTGAITHLGFPLFFKEDVLHKVYPSTQGAHSVQDTACRGVQAGCEKSLVIINGVLYYKSRDGVCGFDGSLPTSVSTALGNAMYFDAVAGGVGNEYYISMVDEAGESHLFTFDTSRGIWHRQDDAKITDFCTTRGQLYGICGDQLLNFTRDDDGEVVCWEAQTGPMGIFTSDAKYMTGISIRAWLGMNSSMSVFTSYDLTGDWTQVACVTGDGLRSWQLPISVRRYDHVYLKIVGMGDAKIYSITKTLEQGSDVR